VATLQLRKAFKGASRSRFARGLAFI